MFGSDGDNTGALSRSSGFLEGLTGGLAENRAEQAKQKALELQALRQQRSTMKNPSDYAKVPGNQAKLYDKNWNENEGYPLVGWNALVQNAKNRDLNKSKIALNWANARKSSGKPYDDIEARKAAMDLSGGKIAEMAIMANDPEVAQDYENHYNQIRQAFGMAPAQLFDFTEETPGTFGFGGSPRSAKLRAPLFAPAKKALKAAPAPAAAPDAGGTPLGADGKPLY